MSKTAAKLGEAKTDTDKAKNMALLEVFGMVSTGLVNEQGAVEANETQLK